jgi:hypothetical protein
MGGTLVAVKRLLLIVAVVALLAAACGGAEGDSNANPATSTESTAAPTSPELEQPSAPGDTSTSESPSTSGGDDPVTTTAAPQKAVEGPAAPDFTLALADGRGDFVLSVEQKPVFMVFWAEW